MSIMNRINRKIKQAKKLARKNFALRTGITPYLERERNRRGLEIKPPQRKYMDPDRRRGIDGTMRW